MLSVCRNFPAVVFRCWSKCSNAHRHLWEFESKNWFDEIFLKRATHCTITLFRAKISQVWTFEPRSSRNLHLENECSIYILIGNYNSVPPLKWYGQELRNQRVCWSSSYLGRILKIIFCTGCRFKLRIGYCQPSCMLILWTPKLSFPSGIYPLATYHSADQSASSLYSLLICNNEFRVKHYVLFYLVIDASGSWSLESESWSQENQQSSWAMEWHYTKRSFLLSP